MKKSKILTMISGILSGIFLMQNVALASMQVGELTQKAGSVLIPVKTDTGAITYKVYKSNSSDVKGLGEEYSENNKLLVDFGLILTGDYKVIISDENETKQKDFVYASKSDRDIFIDKLTDAVEMPSITQDNINSSAAEIHSLFIDNDNYRSAKSVGVNVDEYILYSDVLRNEICTKVAALNANNTLEENSFADMYLEVEAIARVNKGTKENGMKTVERLNFEFDGVQIDDIDNPKKDWITATTLKNGQENRPFETIANIETAYKKAYALYKINTSKITNVTSVIDGYATLLGITEKEEYKNYKNAVNNDINTTLINDISVNKPETVKTLLTALDNAVPDSTGEDGGVGGDDGGGSGGGLGGGGGAGGGLGGAGTQDKNSFAIGETINPSSSDNNSVVQVTEKFRDVTKEHWAFEAVDAMQREGIISGYGDGTFLPEKTVTREEFVKMIISAFGLNDDSASSHFHDVFDSDWFYPYVSAAFKCGIVTGDHLGLFGVNTGITRQDAAVIASRTMKTAGKNINTLRDYKTFADEVSISDYAKDAVKELYCMGRINGTDKGEFEPQRFCTRAEAAMIIYNISR